MAVSALLRRDAQAGLFSHVVHRAEDGLFHVVRRDGLEFKDRAAAQDRIKNIEIGILRRGGNQRDLAVFNVLQQGLLLLFVEGLDLVEVQQHAVGREKGVELPDDLLDIRSGGGGRVELVERALRGVCDDVRDGRLAGAARPVEDQVRYLAGFDHAAQHFALAQNFLLPDHVVQRPRPQLVRQWLIHPTTPFR